MITNKTSYVTLSFEDSGDYWTPSLTLKINIRTAEGEYDSNASSSPPPSLKGKGGFIVGECLIGTQKEA